VRRTPSARRGTTRNLEAADTRRPMAQENVEIVRRGYEHFNRSGEVDYSILDSDSFMTCRGGRLTPLSFAVMKESGSS
jgi:hypothetical protein